MSITPPEEHPPQRENPPQREHGRSITCECCGSRLDRHGNLLKRGDMAKQMIDADDKIAELKKQLAKAAEDLTAANTTIDQLKAAIPEKKRGFFDIEV